MESKPESRTKSPAGKAGIVLKIRAFRRPLSPCRKPRNPSDSSKGNPGGRDIVGISPQAVPYFSSIRIFSLSPPASYGIMSHP